MPVFCLLPGATNRATSIYIPYLEKGSFSYVFFVVVVIHSFLNILFYYGLSQETGYSFLCSTVGPCCLSILNVIVCIYQPQIPSQLCVFIKMNQKFNRLPVGCFQSKFLLDCPAGKSSIWVV